MNKRILAMTALMAASSAVFAQATATASVSNINFHLVDLNPDDGIAPALVWVDTDSGATARWGQQLGQKAGAPQYSNTFQQQNDVVGFNGSTSVSNANISAATGSNSLQVAGQIPSGGSMFASSYHAGYFTLTPQTAVTFSAQFDSHVTATTPSYAPEPNGYFDWAYYQVSTGADITVLVDGYNWNFLCCAILSGARSSAGLHDATQDDTKQLTRTFTNSLDTTQRFGVLVNASISAYTVKPLVPEPQSWALMLMGVTGLACVRSRQRRRQG
jgi:hypothetical protein